MSPKSEFLLILDLQSQLKGWLEENIDRFERKPLQTVVINKILYYTAMEKSLPITRGWFRYGPCIDEFRLSNEMAQRSLEFLDSKPPIDETLIKECEAHFKEFFADSSRYKDRYLSYIYQKRVDFPELKKVYPAKHALITALYLKAAEKEYFETSDIIRRVSRFNTSISEKKYTEFVHLPVSFQETAINFGLSVIEAFESESDNQPALSVLRHDVASIFNEQLFKTLSFLNYQATLQTQPEKRSMLNNQLDFSFKEFQILTKVSTQEINKKLAKGLGYTNDQILRSGIEYRAT